MKLVDIAKKFKKIALALMALTLLSGCFVTNPQRTSLSESDSTDTDGTVPPTSSTANYFNKSGVLSTSVTLESELSDMVLISGKDIYPYLKQSPGSISCLVASFPNSAVNGVLVLGLAGKSAYDYSTNVKNYYYAFDPNDTTINKLRCNTPGLQSIIASKYPGKTISFDIKNVCSNCTASYQDSGAIQFYTSTGTQITDINSSYLKIRIDYLNNTVPSGSVQCSENDTCVAQGFSCCSNGICVTDRALKPGATESDEYDQAMTAVGANPENYKDWPNIFFICENLNSGEVDPNPYDPPDDVIDPFEELKELYECTNPIQGEMSVCTVRYSDITRTDSFNTGTDDRHFGTTYTGWPDKYVSGTIAMPLHGLYEVTYAGKVLYQDRAFTSNGTYFTINNGNDSLTDATQISNITYVPDSSAPNNDLTIRYKIDGSCIALSSTLAKCYKLYVQGQNIAQTDDHFPASNDFLLPLYADTSRSVIVEVDGYRKQRDVHWSLIGGTKPQVKFIGTDIMVQDTQQVKITYYVNLNSYDVLQRKQEALDRIVEICKCSGSTDYCNLTPVYNSSNTSITGYSCTYSDPSDTPLDEIRYINFSAKSAPHRLFDPNGVPKSEILPNVVDGEIKYQEGNKFEYTNGDLLKPNNTTQYIGFNEIYGSFTDAADSAHPAKEVAVEKDHTYNIIVRTGNFSNCVNCGTDYYKHLARLFPDSFSGEKGGGYNPLLALQADDPTDRFNSRTYRADDLKFGRACYVPATMIPWTHLGGDDRQEQRLSRLTAQHFLFANGYQRDWYGFDYGALIGSFDGVTWFAIGNERQIRAKRDKLFLAINGHFSDLTEDSTFQIIITDITISGNNDDFPTKDYDTTAAQCRKYHYCDTDQDCIGQLGWDYVCEDVAGIKTPWPSFDQSSLEIPKASETQFLKDIIGTIKVADAGTKRCVYRGKGAPCDPDYSNPQETSTYHQTTSSRLSACSMNTYCQPLQHGTYYSKFNNRINRYGLSVEYKNAKLQTEDHTFGLIAPIIGRPFNYNGDEPPAFATDASVTGTGNNFKDNNITAICIPGRDVSSGNISFIGQHSAVPDDLSNGDKVNQIGMTPSDLQVDHFLSSCSILDEAGDYYHLSSSNFNNSLNNSGLMGLAGQQALSTNSLLVLLGLTDENDLVQSFASDQITSPTLEQNRCLRAPGSPCFTNFDCAPSSFISTRVSELDEENTTITNILNKYEIMFWKEDLICAQKARNGASDYKLKNNICCRALGKTLTIGTYQNQSGLPDFTTNEIAGIDISSGDPRRNSRITPVSKEIKEGTLLPLEVTPDNQCATGTCANVATVLDEQYKTFDEIATRTCCSQSWVRNFDGDENGGGHKWGPLKTQNIPKDIFKCLNWNVCPEIAANVGDPVQCGNNPEGFSCNHVDDPDDVNCLFRSTSKSEAEEIFNWIGTLELTGIPQVAIKGEDFSELRCRVDYDYQYKQNASILRGTVDTSATAEYQDDSGYKMYSATDSTNFDDDIKKIFSKDQVSCCLGVGQTVQDGDSDSICCSGFINEETGRCALPDYTDVSLYFNRNVSSEGKGLSDSDYDPETGYIKDPSLVVQLACQKRACASGHLHYGVALAQLKVPGQELSDKLKQRFVDSNAAASNYENIADYYDAGLKWNTHVYCFPSTTADLSESVNLSVIQCSE